MEWRSRGNELLEPKLMRGFRYISIDDVYDRLIEHAVDFYNEAVEEGVEPATLRHVLPQGYTYTLENGTRLYT